MGVAALGQREIWKWLAGMAHFSGLGEYTKLHKRSATQYVHTVVHRCTQRERDRETNRQTDRHRQRDGDRDGQTDRDNVERLHV